MKNALAPAVRYELVLFVVGNEPNSMRARTNRDNICAEYLHGGNCAVTVVDILQDYQAALDNNVLVAPTLIVRGPRGTATIIGNLSDVDRIVALL